MITPDQYPVYNHRVRPGIGRDHLGNTHFNCFSISLQRDETERYLPYLFSDFIQQYNQYPKHSAPCESCISASKLLTFPAANTEVDRSAVEWKFSQGEDVDESQYYYCPLIREVLLASILDVEQVPTFSKDLPAQPIQAILGGNWDDSYLFGFERLAPPHRVHTCQIYKDVTSSQFVATRAERSFLVMWILSMLQCMETSCQSGQRVYLEEFDFDQTQSKLLGFLFPIPQVWVYVIPKPPPRVDWKQWEDQHQSQGLPQRVDFLFTYQGKRHIVELDDIGHYGVKSGSAWLASESQYRQTLNDTRWLRRFDFEVHRLTNQEILELYDPNASGEPDVEGFIRLLRSESLEPTEMVLLNC